MQRVSQPRPELLRLLELLSATDRRVMAQLWHAPDHEPTPLATFMTTPEHVQRQCERLTNNERAALMWLLQRRGVQPVAIFQREWGGVREPSGFEHPRAYLEALRGPATPSERLFSMGFIFRAHDERGAVYRIPADLLPCLPQVPPVELRLSVAPVDGPVQFEQALPTTVETIVRTLLTLAYNGALKALDDGALNKASLVKVARSLPDAPELRLVRREIDWPLVAFVRSAATAAGLLRRNGNGELRATTEALEWLQAPQAERCRQLLDGWCISTIDELTLLCDLRWKGGAPYTLNRTATRRRLLQLLATLPGRVWVRLDNVVAEVRRVDPDFQRRDGRYDTWLLYDEDDRLVSAWHDWDRVEGLLVRALLQGPLFWLGLVDQGRDRDHSKTIQLNALGQHLLVGAAPPPEPDAASVIVQSTFEVVCPPGTSLYAHFQLSRFAVPQHTDTVAIYRLTRAALLTAAERGITAEDVLRFLEQQSGGHVPPGVAYTLREWGGQAEQLRIEQAVLLHATDPVILAQVRNLKVSGLDHAEALSPTTVRIPDGGADELVEQLRRAGFGLRDERVDVQLPLKEKDLLALLIAGLSYTRVCAELGLPSEVTPALLQRLSKLLPPRWEATATQATERLMQELIDRIASAHPSDDTSETGMRS